ncbi:TetR/AcrR family transcriptional regulator [Saccharothrix coeruleofusca]|uniref:TetR family transcriptional regulator n=1 Tax=Saccharothrix coeruleofusca TaxID=33919 RepID=A0A918AME6_9PSEU|nr:TetR/AcrR family transcriptional regulator [Saccharothrix coeruleofusca]MBP2336031.1 AcrR family transcriptional regulator [Saccharothrix coeruleofusca]GGP55950.1 TetR family transcriptional regulator [Saccharothrix coeruleofusca]
MDTRQRLLDATRELLWQRGYAATSPNAIMKAARAGQGSLYHHFAGKEDLAAEALRGSAEQLREEAAAILDGEGSPAERIERYLTRERDSLRGCRIGRMTADADVLTSDRLRQPVSETLAWLVDRLAGLIADAQAAGELRADLDPRATASCVASTVQGGYVLARAAGSTEPFDQAITGAVQLLRGAMVG